MIRIMILDDEAIYLEKERKITHSFFLPEKELNTELKYFSELGMVYCRSERRKV